MSTHLNDLASAALVKVAVVPAVITADISTPAISCDMIEGDGNVTCSVILGAINAATGGTIQVQESTDGSTWTNITAGLLTFVNTDDNTVAMVNFQRTKRYLGATVDLTGTPAYSAGIAVTFTEMKKTKYS